MTFYKAISLWQPWASLWVSPAKRHETRHWQTSHRGILLVHAAKRRPDDLNGTEVGNICDSLFGHHWDIDLPFGAIVGYVHLIDVIPTEKLYPLQEPLTDADWEDIACGDFSAGRFAWRRGSHCRFASPIPYQGHQTLFDVPGEIIADQMVRSPEIGGGE